MSLQKLKNQKGFTIVELLIVIVVIGILAAISIAAYAGVTQNANSKAALSGASSVLKVAQTFNAECPSSDGTTCTASGYPSITDIASYSGASGASAKLPNGVSLKDTTLSSSDANGKSIQYLTKGTTGVCVGYWDQKANTFKYLYAGDATTGTNGATPACT